MAQLGPFSIDPPQRAQRVRAAIQRILGLPDLPTQKQCDDWAWGVLKAQIMNADAAELQRTAPVPTDLGDYT